MDRYLRHSLIDWFPLERVQNCRIAIVGCGAIGNEVAKNLALLGIGNIDLYDYDIIETHNLTKSVLFREEDVGRMKAQIAAVRLRELNPDISVSAHHGDFWDTLSLLKMNIYSSIIGCVDNFEARVRLNFLCRATCSNFIDTGIDSKFGQVSIFPYKYNTSASCYECSLPYSVYARMQERYSCGWLRNLAFIEKKIPTTVITASLAGSLAASKALQLIVNEEPTNSLRLFANSFTGEIVISEIEKNNECPCCSSLGKTISITSKNPSVDIVVSNFTNKNQIISTSEPILISMRCVKCNRGNDAKIIFERAEKYDSSHAICPGCSCESIAFDIRDRFSISELKEHFSGRNFPVKFIRRDSVDSTTIIEME